MKYTIEIPTHVAKWYAKLAANTGKSICQILADTLIKYAEIVSRLSRKTY